MQKDQVKVVLVTGKSGAGKQPRIDAICDFFGAQQLSTGNIFRELIGKFNASGFQLPIAALWNSAANAFHTDAELTALLTANCKTPAAPADVPQVILGGKAKYYVENGLFCPDELTNALFASAFVALLHAGKKIVLDGFPRTVAQYHFLKQLLEQEHQRIDFDLHVELDDDFIVRRATGRRICPKCQAVYHTIFVPARDGRFCKTCPGDVEVKQRADDSTEEKLRCRLHEFAEKVVPMLEEVKADHVPFVVIPGHLEDPSKESLRRSVLSAVEPLFH
ncbi:putative adenylate kinase [Paratrimastix pyriformis]|uniref:Adenylate kinase n=1 Tax=Paratrimastix pyriformis TaxID=342808 RepID=A0ABQ8UE67_9EUKA|nr:putative adenylate kinase [Paratrimastix pyriformis]